MSSNFAANRTRKSLKVIFHFSENLPLGRATLRISYAGQLGQDSESQGQGFIVTLPIVFQLSSRVAIASICRSLDQ